MNEPGVTLLTACCAVGVTTAVQSAYGDPYPGPSGQHLGNQRLRVQPGVDACPGEIEYGQMPSAVAAGDIGDRVPPREFRYRDLKVAGQLAHLGWVHLPYRAAGRSPGRDRLAHFRGNGRIDLVGTAVLGPVLYQGFKFRQRMQHSH